MRCYLSKCFGMMYGSCHACSISQMSGERKHTRITAFSWQRKGLELCHRQGSWIGSSARELAEGMTGNSPNLERSLKVRAQNVFLQWSTVSGASWEPTFATLGEATCLGRATTQCTGRTKICKRHHCIFNARGKRREQCWGGWRHSWQSKAGLNWSSSLQVGLQVGQFLKSDDVLLSG